LADYWDGEDIRVIVELYNGSRVQAVRKEIIAIECHGPAPRFICPVCGDTSIRNVVEQLNGNPRDSSPDNLTYLADTDVEREHEVQCLERLMWEPSRTRTDAGYHPNGSPSGWGIAPLGDRSGRIRRPSLVDIFWLGPSS
jgi:hypothetical protein